MEKDLFDSGWKSKKIAPLDTQDNQKSNARNKIYNLSIESVTGWKF